MLTPFCGTVDFEKWETSLGDTPPEVAGIPLTRYWLIPAEQRPKMFMPHPTMSSEEMRQRTQGVMGPVLQPALDLEALAVHARSAHPSGVPLHFETVPADVRQH